MRAFSVRKAPKDHGLEGRLVGPVEEGDHVVVVEDTTTTGVRASRVFSGPGDSPKAATVASRKARPGEEVAGFWTASWPASATASTPSH